jgi:YetA-like protein
MNPVDLHWLDGAAPGVLPGGTTCGLALHRGTVGSVAELALADAGGTPVPAQFWPLATWPDGSLKWVGAAIGATDTPAAGYTVRTGAAVPGGGLAVAADEDAVTVDTGALTCVVPRSGPVLVRSIARGDEVVARDGRLVSLLQHDLPEDGSAARTPYASEVETVTVEQDGPLRGVVRIEGVHRAGDGSRRRLPFVVRLVFAAGGRSVRMVHTFVWDGDADRDFLAGLGVRFAVPLRAALHDRHVRIAGAAGGFLVEAVRGVTGLRRDPGAEVRAAQVAGLPTPPVGEWDREVASRLDLVPAWNDWTLAQLSPDGFTLRKRTAAGHGWVGTTGGTRAEGFAYLGDPQGGFGIGVRHFWQSYPGQLDVRGAATGRGEVTAWLYSPQAPPMDLRFYHDGLGQDDHASQYDGGLEITYEDYEPGFGDPHGIARTHELTLFAYEATPRVEALAADVDHVARPPLLAAAPEHLHAVGVFGDWSLVDRSTPARAALEDRLDFLLDFYAGQVEQRRWYGFWDFGDVMHAYDPDRHVWRYDVGGYAWDNSELSPDLWLWYAYLRTGRADVFRLAEAMTRHTGEVDVYHAGRWKGLGSRHNVQHWGCSAKQLRISSPAYRRIFFYLTADERTGDLLSELRDSDATFLALDPLRKVRPDATAYRPRRGALGIGLGTDWGALAATWLTDWERTGDPWSRDRLLGTMADIGALRHGFFTGEALYDLDAGRFDTTRVQAVVSHLSAVFGLVEICSELIDLVDVPEFGRAWLQYCRLYLAPPEEQEAELGTALDGIHLHQAHSRLAAYAAARTGNAIHAERAWRAFHGGGEFASFGRSFRLRRVEPPHVLHPVDEAEGLWTNDAAQFALATIQNLALIPDP